MIIHCKNGVEVDNNPYLLDENIDGRTIKVGDNSVGEYRLPAIRRGERILKYLPFANLLYVIVEDTIQDINRYYILEQKLVKGKVQIENIYSTTRVGYANDLERFFKYNKEYERMNIVDFLTDGLKDYLGFAINTEDLRQQIIDRLDGNNEVEAASVEAIPTTPSIGNKTLTELAIELGMPYNTLWNRVHRKGMSIEDAVAMGRGKPRGKYKGGKK